jgi:pectinesterase inhibitor-like protein
MKVSSFSTIIFLTIISSIFLIPPIQCHQPKLDLVEQICRKTPHYHLCLLTLKSNPYSQHLTSNTDISGFVRITLEVVAARAPVILEQLRNVYAQTEHTQLKAALDSCIASYTKISKELVPQAQKCVDKGDYNGVKQSAYTAGNLADSCEKKCNGTTSSAISPLGDSNKYVKNMCAITVSIVTKLPKSIHQTLTKTV